MNTALQQATEVTHQLRRADGSGSHPLPPAGGAVLIGRGGDADVPVLDASCSRRQALVRVTDAAVVIEPLSASVPTLVNGERIESARVLGHLDVIAVGATALVFETLAELEQRAVPARPALVSRVAPLPFSPAAPAPEPSRAGASRTIVGGALGAAELGGEIPLSGDVVLGRDPAMAGVVLDHPQVSRRHAEIRFDRGRTVIRDLRSTNGTWVEGGRINGWTELRPGARVDVGPFALRFTGSSLAPSTREGNLRIVARGLGRTVQSLDTGKPVRILADVTLVIEPREFVCLLGPSGSGKSTLMNALSARVPADQGSVHLNDADLYASFESLKGGIAMVPQHDLLHEDLTLEDALYFTAKLRFPPDTTEAALRTAVDAAIASVDLRHRSKTCIKNLSGGQKKRASLANEIICRPNLLFLDEVTSGLDEGIDWEMMRLFRQMADRGMTVVCVTHSLSNVAEFCHKVVVMAAPGVLAFHGTPAEALEYFGVAKLGDIYRKLGTRKGHEWQRAFLTTSYYRRHVAERLPSGRETATAAASSAVDWRVALRESARQLPILTARLVKLVLADRKTLFAAALQSVVIGALLPLVFETLPEPDPRELAMLFLLGVSAFWFGCNNASKEIVKERLLYLRERDVNLSVPSYVLSKLVVIGVFVALQTGLLFLIVRGLSRVPGDDLPQLGQMLLVSLAGTSLGLLISAGSNTPDQANTLVPIALIPQIVLAGVIVEQLPRIPDAIAHGGITGFWMFEGMKAVLLDDAARAHLALGVQCAHALAFVAATLAVLFLRDRRSAGAGR